MLNVLLTDDSIYRLVDILDISTSAAFQHTLLSPLYFSVTSSHDQLFTNVQIFSISCVMTILPFSRISFRTLSFSFWQAFSSLLDSALQTLPIHEPRKWYKYLLRIACILSIQMTAHNLSQQIFCDSFPNKGERLRTRFCESIATASTPTHEITAVLQLCYTAHVKVP